MAAVRKATPAPKPRPASVAKLSESLRALEARVESLEGLLESAKLQRQREAAAKLAQNPEQLKALAALVQLAQQGQG